jgi:hypothetical protein
MLILIFDRLARQMQAATRMNHPAWLSTHGTRCSCCVRARAQFTVTSRQRNRLLQLERATVEEMPYLQQPMHQEFASPLLDKATMIRRSCMHDRS